MLTKIITGLALVVTLAGFWLWNDYQASLTAIVTTENKPSFEIVKGDSFNKITQKLIAAEIKINPYWFKLYAYQNKLTQQIKVGEFNLPANLTAPDLLDILVAGKVKQYSITFPEGWNFKQLMQALNNSAYLQHSLSGLTDEEIMLKIDQQKKHPEGLFFPDTYYFEKNMTDLSILQRAYHKMQKVLEQEWQNKQADLPLETSYEALVLASIVEKETGLASERPVIAGVFSRRLKKGMRLQSDPTIIYGMGDSYDGNIRSKDIVADTAYNTYVIKALPPTPIAMPGQHAIHSVLHPAPGKSIYFVARGNGSHVFSSTLQEHNRAVNKFQRKK